MQRKVQSLLFSFLWLPLVAISAEPTASDGGSSVAVEIVEEAKKEVRAEVEEDVREDVKKEIKEEVKEEVREEVKQEIKGEVREEVKEEVREEIKIEEKKLAEESEAIIEQMKSVEGVTSTVPVTTETQKKEIAKAKTWIPSAVDYDWIQLTSNEWLKGEIKGMYKDRLEFDSDKLNLLKIDWEDVKILRSHRVNNANIDGIGAASGVLEVTNNNVQLINDYDDAIYDRSKLISFAPGGDHETDLWSVKAFLGFDVQEGNTKQLDYIARLTMKRQASVTRLVIDYTGNISKTGDGDNGTIKTTDNHRLSAIYDYFKTQRFFYTPVFSEYYRDPFTNIDWKVTLGTGLGYTLIDKADIELEISGGPAYVRTQFSSVQEGADASESTIAAVFRTNYDFELTDTLDFIAEYGMQIGRRAAGGYIHHMVLSVENELTQSVDIDISFTWDRTTNPAKKADGSSPETDDYRMSFGFAYTF